MLASVLLKVKRSGIVEREHSGLIVVVDKNEKIISQIGENIDIPFFLRSCAKPFQALPIIRSGAHRKFNLDLQEIAVCCGSHTGSYEHIKVVKNILTKLGLSEEHLQCGIHDPIDAETRNYLIRQYLDSSPIYNNCSGKHTGMLAVCLNNNWDISQYLDFNHPLQKEILAIILEYCNLDNDIKSSVDGCSAPIYAMPLYKMGVGYLNLFLSKDNKLMKKAYIETPVMIGGKGRLDSSIIEATKGKLISKVGAEGLCVVVNLEKEQALVVKILDSNVSARSIVVIEAIKQLNWISDTELRHENIMKHYNLDVKNLKNTIVGKIEVVFDLNN